MDSDLLDPTVTMIAFDRLPTPGPSKLSFISPPVSRASSLSGDDHRDTPDPSSSSSKTHSFFSNPFSSKPSVPNLRPPPRLVPTTPSNRSVSDSSPRAATDSFFSSANVSPRPTPPPSIHSHSRNSSEGDGTTPKPLLPPIARFFPSRGPTLPDPRRIPDDRDDLLSPPMPTSASPSSSARSFVSLEIDDASDFGGGALTTSSPTSATPSSPTFSSPKFNYSRSSASSSAPSSTSSSVDPSYILRPNAIIGADVPLSLVRKLGDGAFSSVWLAVDIDHHLSPGILRNKRRLRSQSDARHKRDINLHGLRPSGRTKKEKDDTILLDEHDGEGGSLPHLIVSREGGEESDDEDGEHDLGRLVAVKMMDRAMCDADDRTRISFVREVEVLRVSPYPIV
ncbi:hypothetical protein SISSUDRAFT_488744 [Sistotremastrum suecicum HHB10207 ss-3]|uniref:Protein kinase domain-containing protein n=1 Tax=Sistotremastrum suecicum HHB10207 ss-3 TaxID=1314776 RepID=A0A165Y0C3_9AGAM|nr:hypothetical protein SISSUDRAFT_488744 [Sistotremastrum suecicum HHB10207 ss-3]